MTWLLMNANLGGAIFDTMLLLFYTLAGSGGSQLPCKLPLEMLSGKKLSQQSSRN